jgi:Protein of unknown function (DUF433)
MVPRRMLLGTDPAGSKRGSQRRGTSNSHASSSLSASRWILEWRTADRLSVAPVWATTILDWLADGRAVEAILREYPQLEPADIRACVAYSAELTRFRDVTVEPV